MNILVTGDSGEVRQELKKLFAKEKYEIAGSFIDGCDVLVSHGQNNDATIGTAKAVVINSDNKGALNKATSSDVVVTYGFNSRACITASSISADTMQVCVQRSLPCVNGSVLEQQEFSLPLSVENSPEATLAAAAAALVCGFPPHEISKNNK